MIPTLLHIPHSSRHIPSEYLPDYFLSAEALWKEHIRLVDMYTDELYQLAGAARAIFPVSRFLVDAERFSDDAQEPMAARGMGVLYTVTTDLSPLRAASTQLLREELLSRFYTPHHHALDVWAEKNIAQHGAALLIDCHSYPSLALPYEQEGRALNRPMIGIGTDPFHTPLPLEEAIVKAFVERGYDVGLNEPFAGTLTPSACYGKDKRLSAFMVEIRKDLYMNEENGEKHDGFSTVQKDLCDVLSLAREVASNLARQV